MGLTKTQLKDMLISDIMKYIIIKHTIAETAEYSKRRCLYYFPLADDILLNTISDYSTSLQNLYNMVDVVDKQVKLYKNTVR